MQLIQVGKLLKAHGLNGEAKILIEEQYIDQIVQMRYFFVKKVDGIQPLFIEYFRGVHAHIVKFETLNNREQLRHYTGTSLFLKEADANLIYNPAKDNSKSDYERFLGYILFDELSEVGKIQQIDQYAHQDIALVDHQGKLVSIPMVEQWIISVDDNKKILKMDLPEGLLDL